jgi:hypothetical protein
MVYIDQHFGLSGKLSRLARNTVHPKLAAPRGAVTAHMAAGKQ